MKMKKQTNKSMKKKYIVLQAKGGSAKTTLAKAIWLYFSKNNELVKLIDVDNNTPAFFYFLSQLPQEKRKNFTCSSFNLLSSENNIDRSLIDLYINEISKDENSVSDFGAAESSALLYWLQEEQKNGIVDTLEEAGVLLLIVLTGGISGKECFDYAKKVMAIEGIEKIVRLVANEYHGDISGQSVSEYYKADITIGALKNNDNNSDSQKEWNKLLKDGCTYEDLEGLTIVRKRRIKKYLDNIFDQIEKL